MSDDRVTALLAREAIRDLPQRYCDFVWRDDIAGLVDLFTPDASFTAVFDGGEKTFSGHAELRDFFIAGLTIAPRPFIHNHVVDLHDAVSATGRCYLDLYSAKKNMESIGAGFYEDEYALDDGRWRFRSRRLTALRMDDLPAGFTE
ncbi:MAG: nuclear transport factor 2 family protein [Gammaproteobacteria bacterium]